MELTLRMLRVIEVKFCAQGHSQLVPEGGLKFMSPDSKGDSFFWQWKGTSAQVTEVTVIKSMDSGIQTAKG